MQRGSFWKEMTNPPDQLFRRDKLFRDTSLSGTDRK